MDTKREARKLMRDVENFTSQWIIDAIESYLQEIPIEKADKDSLLDFVCSSRPTGILWTEYLRNRTKEEIEKYI